VAKKGILKRITHSIRRATGSEPPEADEEDEEPEPEAEAKAPANGKGKKPDITRQFKTTMSTLHATADRAKNGITEECKGLRDESHKLRRTLISLNDQDEVPSEKPSGG